ncbi:MAG: carbamoyl phosphate synthase small subunit [Clostridiales bacterium]|jgi:carbamoyl-phosphate synthase small subunit|nr:carbamoyl phosphate synthase small subunit [Clostridiales bacterium]
MSNTAYLVLENGKMFRGKSFGASLDNPVVGEVVFATGMTGYLETITDKSYFGQIVVQTFPLIGNYGVIESDLESDTITPKAYIVRSVCANPSNFRSQGTLDAFLKSRGVAGLFDIDTRSLTKTIRESGVMNGFITAKPDDVDFAVLKNYKIKDAVKTTTCREIFHETTTMSPSAPRIVLMDYGTKSNIYRELVARKCDVFICPADTPFEQIMSLSPNGIMLSNGPGDPEDNPTEIATIKKLFEAKIPMFGICLGHQLMALAAGFKTEKMKYGHRGANQSVKNLKTGQVFITSQNHGYAVVNDSINKRIGSPLFINVNDGTNEGIEYKLFPAFSSQFHPEAAAGPRDAAFLFDIFIEGVAASCR